MVYELRFAFAKTVPTLCPDGDEEENRDSHLSEDWGQDMPALPKVSNDEEDNTPGQGRAILITMLGSQLGLESPYTHMSSHFERFQGAERLSRLYTTQELSHAHL